MMGHRHSLSMKGSESSQGAAYLAGHSGGCAHLGADLKPIQHSSYPAQLTGNVSHASWDAAVDISTSFLQSPGFPSSCDVINTSQQLRAGERETGSLWFMDANKLLGPKNLLYRETGRYLSLKNQEGPPCPCLLLHHTGTALCVSTSSLSSVPSSFATPSPKFSPKCLQPPPQQPSFPIHDTFPSYWKTQTSPCEDLKQKIFRAEE